MISKRTNTPHARIPENDERYIRIPERRTYTVKHVPEKPLKLSPYWQEIYRQMFEGWHYR